MKRFFLIQILVMIIFSTGTLLLSGQHEAASVFIGSFITTLNVGLLGFVWNRVVKKKLIALAVLIIVFKYALLGIILYKLLHTEWVSIIFLSVGFSSLVLSSVIFALFSEDENEELVKQE